MTDKYSNLTREELVAELEHIKKNKKYGFGMGRNHRRSGRSL
jgi:hypothetical protein